MKCIILLIMDIHNEKSYNTLVLSQWTYIQTIAFCQVNGGIARDIFKLLYFSDKNTNIFVNNRAIDVIFFLLVAQRILKITMSVKNV